jgi:phage terminase small subunit
MRCQSELENVRNSKLSYQEPTKNVDASVQRRKQFGPRTNDKSEKSRKFENVAIQKPQYRKAFPVPLTGRTVTIDDSEDESDEVAQYAGIVEDTHLDNYRIMTARNKKSVLGSAFSRFQWLESGEDAIRSKIGTNRFNPIRIDHDIPHHNADQIMNINEPLGCYPISEQVLVSNLKHDDKEINDMEQDDDHYEPGLYHPTNISVPGSMAAAARADERRKLEMELMRGLASRSPLPAATSTCSAPDISSPRLPLQAIFSLSAPQVEYNVLDKMACETEGAQESSRSSCSEGA